MLPSKKPKAEGKYVRLKLSEEHKAALEKEYGSVADGIRAVVAEHVLAQMLPASPRLKDAVLVLRDYFKGTGGAFSRSDALELFKMTYGGDIAKAAQLLDDLFAGEGGLKWIRLTGRQMYQTLEGPRNLFIDSLMGMVQQ